MGNGKGTPWGPMDTGRPDDFNPETDPNKFQGFDYSPIKAQLMNEIGLQGGDAQRQYLASQSKLLGSGTQQGSQSGRLANLAAMTQKNQSSLAADIAMKEWKDKVELMNAFNRAKQAKYQADLGAFNNEQQGRAGFIGSALGAGAQGLGAYLGR